LYTTIYSILLFYAIQLNLIKQETLLASRTYSFIAPWGPHAINGLGAIIPWFKDMFLQLEEFFGGVSQKMSGL
jgi:membrane protein required for colicin V production